MASIFPRTWQTKSGGTRTSWRVQFYAAGVAKKRDFPTQRQAKRFAENIGTVRERELKEQQAGRSPRIEQVAREWIEACRRGRDGAMPLEPLTIEWYEGMLRNWVVPQLGKTRIQAMTPAAVREFRDTLLEAPSLSRRTAKKVLAALKTMVGFAIEEGYLVSDPTARIGIRLSRRDHVEVQIHSKAEMMAVFATAGRLRASSNKQIARSWQRYWPLLHVLVYAGLRLSEVRGLQRDAVDTLAGTIHVRQRADKRGRIGAPKSAKGTRRIHIPDDTAAAIGDWLPAHGHPLVFATSTGRPVDGKNVRKWLWHAVQREAGVRVLTLHSCRHFFASREIERGTNLKELCDLMGHADEAFTLRVYGHLFRDSASEKRRRAEANERVLV